MQEVTSSTLVFSTQAPEGAFTKIIPPITMSSKKSAVLTLEDGTIFTGFSFGADASAKGEVVFNTAMGGYPEMLSDPGSHGHIVVLTYPLIGNYGVPPLDKEGGLMANYESDKAQVAALVVTDYSEEFSHWNAAESLGKWLKDSRVPAICGVDTRALAQHLRDKGEMSGVVTIEGAPMKPDSESLIADVSIEAPTTYGEGDVTVVLVDTGVKNNVIRSLVRRGVRVVRVPWNYDVAAEGADSGTAVIPAWDGLVLVGAPDDPTPAADNVRKALTAGKPVLGVCGGDLLLALAVGGRIQRLPRTHHGANLPVLETGTNHAQITTQNHSWAVDPTSLPEGWQVWYENLNDGSCEGIRHQTKPMWAVQFHPEPVLRPVENHPIYDNFIDAVRNGKK